MQTYLAVAVAGVLGCWLRLFMGNFIPTFTGRDFPWATLAINIIGSFLMGFLFVATAERFAISQPLRVGILTGFLGGFTTFSAFSMEMLLLVQGGEPGKGAIYAV
ncbi:MAG: fluoride efflux transporter CrcB, partial [Stellaceae bacterium]